MVPPFDSTNPETSYPQDLNDSDLDNTAAGQDLWHGSTTSYVPGLVALGRLFLLWYKSQQGDCTNLQHLRHHMDIVSASLDNLPPFLRWRGGLSRPSKSNFGTDVQMVNLYITQIHIRSFLMDQMHQVATRNNDTVTISELITSRQMLVDDM